MDKLQERDWVKVNPESKYANHMTGSWEVVYLYENGMVKLRNGVTSFIIPIDDCMLVSR